MCLSPIWIKNKAYVGLSSLKDRSIKLSNRPWDVFLQRIMVPCGKCEECLRQLRNDWFVRLERETTYQRFLHRHSVFVTITISPKYYEQALASPSDFIRIWFERLRHRLGHSIKHAIFQEFGMHPETGGEPRLHFHGVLWDVTDSYSDIRSAIGDLGFVWIGALTMKRLRYVVKYIAKGIYMDDKSRSYAEMLQVTVDKEKGYKISLYGLLQNKKYRRKFVSAHVGDYLGNFKIPSERGALWTYLDAKTGRVFNYRIPRYYDKYLSQESLLYRKISNAWSYAVRFNDGMGLGFLRRVAEFFLSGSAVSSVFRGNSSRLVKLRKFLSLSDFRFAFPKLTPDVLEFFKDAYDIDDSDSFIKLLLTYG